MPREKQLGYYFGLNRAQMLRKFEFPALFGKQKTSAGNSICQQSICPLLLVSYASSIIQRRSHDQEKKGGWDANWQVFCLLLTLRGQWLWCFKLGNSLIGAMVDVDVAGIKIIDGTCGVLVFLCDFPGWLESFSSSTSVGASMMSIKTSSSKGFLWWWCPH